MTRPSSDEPIIDRILSWARSKSIRGPRSAFGTAAASILPVTEQRGNGSTTVVAFSSSNDSPSRTTTAKSTGADNYGNGITGSAPNGSSNADNHGGRRGPRHRQDPDPDPDPANTGRSGSAVKNSYNSPSLTISQAARKGLLVEPNPALPDPDHDNRNLHTLAHDVGIDASGDDGDHHQDQTEEGSGNHDTDGDDKKPPQSILKRFYLTSRMILLHSWLNVLLVFVPAGIITRAVPGAPPAIIFATNCVAIVPLAGLLSHATETVAAKLGDTVGALLNITFGNAVELIIFIALVKNELRIVQSSLLGSILANLLLILGMCFLLGGLRYREQIYNSTVTQMSACLLSLSVISLVLPTAFHASFISDSLADEQSLKISRGTSVILLLVYIVYLLFQLKSHAYMYESTPQHIIDEEASPGPAAAWLDSSTSDSSSSSDSDSDDSSRSRETVSKRVRRVIRKGRRRKSSVASVDTGDAGPTRTPSFGTTTIVGSPVEEHADFEESSARPKSLPRLNSVEGSEEAIEDDGGRHKHTRRRHRHKKHHNNKKQHNAHDHKVNHGSGDMLQGIADENGTPGQALTADGGETRRVDFALVDDTAASGPAPVGPDAGSGAVLELASTNGRRTLERLRAININPRTLTPTIFSQPPRSPGAITGSGRMQAPSPPTGSIPRVRYGIRRTNSLPDRLNQYHFRPPGAMMPSQVPLAALASANAANHAAAAGSLADGDKAGAGEDGEYHMSRTTAVILLLVSTGLVALCAEFLVGSIQDVTRSSKVGEIFIGLIVLPIVGNAAEHVTAITVAMKNKMDLAIGVAVGSSIQIALFITPLIVILGWIIDRKMTLYFTLFETVCLFVSAFIVNFLVLDGRSNYLEGALLCSTYIIIGLVAFYYPEGKDASLLGQ